MTNRYKVEKDWTTRAGFRAVVVMGSLGYRCGYVGLPADHPLHGAEYNEPHPSLTYPAGEACGKRGVVPILLGGASPRPDVVFDVHGSLTYARAGANNAYPVSSDGLWWFGFDCGHIGDAPSPEYVEERRRMFPHSPYMWGHSDGEHRTLEYCIDECESLAQQLIDRVKRTENGND